MRVKTSGPKRIAVSLAAIAGVATVSLASSPALAETCYLVVNAYSVNMRAKPRMSADVVTTIKGGTLVRKVGLPVCGLWWCKVETGMRDHVGYIGSKFLEKEPCP